MGNGGWVALDKELARTMKEINRPYSHVEAMFSHSVNVNCGKPWSIKGYAEAWRWDRKKVRRFLDEIPTEEGYGACKKGMSSGYKIRLISLCGIGTEQGHNRDTIGTEQGHQESSNNDTLRWNRDTIGTEQGHNRDTMRDPIIKNKNKEKEKRVLCEEEISHDKNDEFLISAKGKKLTGEKLVWFNSFWEAFGDKRSRAAAIDSFLSIKGLDVSLARLIYKGAKAYADSRPEIIERGGTPKMAQGWLTARRWEDETNEIGGDKKFSLSPEMLAAENERLAKLKG